MYQAKQAKLTEEPPEPSNRTIADQQGDVGESPMVELRIRLPDGQVQTCDIYLTIIMIIIYSQTFPPLWVDNSVHMWHRNFSIWTVHLVQEESMIMGKTPP